jgi:predicted nucleotidyltransferase
MIQKEDILNYLLINKELFQTQFSITKIGIFGSFARNEQSEDSDIDIIMELQAGTIDIYEKKFKLKKLLKKKFRRDVDICREQAIKPLFREMILKDAIYV